MKKYLYLLILAIATLSGIASAEIYKHVDADGRITYSNIKTKGASRLDIDPVSYTHLDVYKRQVKHNASNSRLSSASVIQVEHSIY